MANVKWVWPNFTQTTAVNTVTATGSGWTGLANLQSEVLSEMARYPGVSSSSTKIAIDFGVVRGVGAVAIPFTNAKEGDTARVKLYSDSGLTDLLYDSGAIDFFGVMFPFGSLPAEAEEWIDGKFSGEDKSGRSVPWVHVIGHQVSARYMQILLDFSNNTDGYVDIGRIFAGPVVVPDYNVEVGVSVPFYKDPSTKSRAKGGPTFSDKRKPYRSSKMSVKLVDMRKTYQIFFEMIRRNGISEPLFFIYNSDADKYLIVDQSFACTIENQVEPTAIECMNSSGNLNDFQAEIAESF